MAVTIKRKERVTPELIKRRRSQMLIHSYLYYHLDETAARLLAYHQRGGRAI
jgi:hypothetical protein